MVGGYKPHVNETLNYISILATNMRLSHSGTLS